MTCVLFLAFGILSSSFAQDTAILKEFSTGYGSFSADVYKELSKSETGNFIACPLSLSTVLASAESGAQGQTAKELTTALRLPETRSRTHEMFKAILPNMQKSENYTLSTANKMYVQDGYKIHGKFKNVAVDVFDSEIENVDFSKNTKTADKINQWVEAKTQNKIKQLMDSSALSSDTRIVLVNAIFFHGKWLKGFKTSATKKYSFFLNSQNLTKVTDMMVNTATYDYYESSELKAKFLKMDYEGDDVSMHIVLPNAIDGLTALEQKLADAWTPPNYGSWRVCVRIPKFKIETKIAFKPILQAMGIKSAFGPDANFKDIFTDDVNLAISNVVQKAFIEVEEEGTTAAAATGASFTLLSNPLPEIRPVMFHADHPFLFYLRLNKVGINFFVGRYVSP